MVQQVQDKSLLDKLNRPDNRSGPTPVEDPQLIKRLETPGAPEDIPSQALDEVKESRFGVGFNTGLADMAGLPVDIINAGLNYIGLGTEAPFMGSTNLREIGNSLGLTVNPGEDPQTFAERVGREIGAVSLPTGALIGAGTRVAAGSSSFMGQLARATAQSPGLTTGAELASATGAATGGEIANRVVPNSESAEIIGELAGGFSPAAFGLIAKVNPLRLGGKAAAKAALPFTETGGRFRAARRLQTASPDPERASEDVERLAGTGLSPAQRTGQKQLLEIENAVRSYDPKADERLSQSLTEAQQTLRSEASSVAGEGSRKDRVREILQNHGDYLLDTLETRSAIAASEFQEKVTDLGQNLSPRDISRAARDTLESAYNQARRTEQEVWSALDTNAETDLSATQDSFQKIISSRSDAADPEDIPSFVPDLLRKGQQGPVNVKFAQDFRSRLGQELATERAKDAPNRKKIAILSDLRDNLLQDMRSAEGQDQALDTALAYSRSLNEKFTQGKVGRLLGFERRGGTSVAPEDTLQKIFSGGTPTTNVEQLFRAAPESREQVKDFLKNTFASAAITPDGNVNRTASSRFFEKYSDVMDYMPEVRDELRGVVSRGQRAQQLVARKKKVERALERPKKTVTALYLNSPLDQEMSRVLRSQNPPKVAAKLRQRMKGDKEAIEGLRQAYVDELFRSSFRGTPDELGNQISSGGSFRKTLNETRKAAKAFGFSDQELSRLESIGQALSRSSLRAGTAEEIVGDRPSRILDTLGGFVGAQIGGKAGTTSGSSLQAANRFSEEVRRILTNLTRDKATEILRRATEDPELYKDLLVSPTAPPKRQKKAAQKLNAFLLTTQTGGQQEQQEEQ